MAEGFAPPFIEPRGPLRDDLSVIRAFVRREPPGYSERFHAEGDILLASRDVAAALRVGATTFLVRADLPGAAAFAKPVVEEGLAAEGLSRFDEDTLFATPVAIQMLGMRLSSWDLWGADIDSAFAELRQAAGG